MTNTDEELAARGFRGLQEASEALMLAQNAPPDPSLYRQVDDYLVDRFGVQLWSSPIVGVNGLPVRYPLKANGVYLDLKQLVIFDRSTHRIEFWASLIGGTDWAGVPRQQHFHLVRAMRGRVARSIIYRSDRFSPVISVPGEPDIVLPLDDPQLVYELSPTDFPDTYAGTPLEGVVADYEDDRGYFLRPPR